MKRWLPAQVLSKREQLLMGRLQRTRKLFGFLRLHRHELFDDSFQAELEAMYRTTGAGEEPVPPALLCMVLLLQGYLHVSDAEAVEMTVVDARWQMVLGCLNAERPPFSQGTLQRFRERLTAADMDRRLLERTVELAKATKEFDWKKLPKDLRLAIDSRPFEGAGRVEDTINLLGHAARKLVQLASDILEVPVDTICDRAGIPILKRPSVKAALDRDWNNPSEKTDAVGVVVEQIDSLTAWLDRKNMTTEEPLKPYIQALAQVRAQNLEETSGRAHIRKGVAEDRRVSIEDSEMRHGRKSKRKRFNGYKEHIAVDLDAELIAACAVTPANRPEDEATPLLTADIRRQGRPIAELSIDRAYVNSELVHDVLAAGGEVLAKPWSTHNSRGDLFSKTDFEINTREGTITCPAGQVESFEPGETVEFDPEVCGPCALRAICTHAASGHGRSVRIAEDEAQQQRFRALQETQSGRQRLRQRVTVEHQLARLTARQGRRARYFGVRKNLFDLRRVASVQNLETIQRKAS